MDSDAVKIVLQSTGTVHTYVQAADKGGGFLFSVLQDSEPENSVGHGERLEKKSLRKKKSQNPNLDFSIFYLIFYFFLLDCTVSTLKKVFVKTLHRTPSHSPSLTNRRSPYNRYRFQCRTVPGTGC